MMMDAFSQALSNRRGGSLDSTLYSPEPESPPESALEGGVAQDAMTALPPPPTQPAQAPVPPMVAPAGLAPPDVDEANQKEVEDAITGHASQQEYSMLKDIKPRSLGERAKIDILRKKYEK